MGLFRRRGVEADGSSVDGGQGTKFRQQRTEDLLDEILPGRDIRADTRDVYPRTRSGLSTE